jgi:hypothetical protein
MFEFFKVSTNLKCVHWGQGHLALGMYENLKNDKKLLEGKYEHYDYYGDMEAFFIKNNEEICFYAHKDHYKLLDQQYPNSKFILNIRNVDDWLKSRMKLYAKSCVGGDSNQNLIDFLKKYYRTDDLEGLWRAHWINHIAEASVYFKYTNRLLIFDIDQDEGKKIIDFFPELNFKNNVFPRVK